MYVINFAYPIITTNNYLIDIMATVIINTIHKVANTSILV
jgi:hypothetical protein